MIINGSVMTASLGLQRLFEKWFADDLDGVLDSIGARYGDWAVFLILALSLTFILGTPLYLERRRRRDRLEREREALEREAAGLAKDG